MCVHVCVCVSLEEARGGPYLACKENGVRLVMLPRKSQRDFMLSSKAVVTGQCE